MNKWFCEVNGDPVRRFTDGVNEEAARTGFEIGPDRFSLVTSKGEIRLNVFAEPRGRFSVASK